MINTVRLNFFTNLDGSMEEGLLSEVSNYRNILDVPMTEFLVNSSDLKYYVKVDEEVKSISYVVTSIRLSESKDIRNTIKKYYWKDFDYDLYVKIVKSFNQFINKGGLITLTFLF